MTIEWLSFIIFVLFIISLLTWLMYNNPWVDISLKVPVIFTVSALILLIWIVLFVCRTNIVENETTIPIIIQNKTQYIVFDLNNETKCINLNKKFGRSFSQGDKIILKTYLRGPYVGLYWDQQKYDVEVGE